MPDLADPLVWELLSRNHVPEEEYSGVKMADGSVRVSQHRIVCEKDGELWPCRMRLLIEATDEPSRLHFWRKRAGDPEPTTRPGE